MTFGLSAAAIGGLAVGAGGIASALIGGNAAQKAASTQAGAAQAGINAQQQQFQQIKQLLAPFVQGGTNAFNMQGNIAGANGAGPQQAALSALENSPIFQGLNKQGQDAILQNAAATGGLRTGNTQAALAQFTPALLNQLLQQQFTNLGSLSTIGENAGAQTGTFGANTANQVSNLLGNQGYATATGQLGQGQSYQNMINSLYAGLGTYRGLSNGGWTTNLF